MKFFAVLALAAVAFAEPEADADPALLYSAYGYGAYGAYGAYPYGYRTYGAYPYGYRTFYGKRSAEPEPEAEADPALLYSAYGYGAYPYGYRTYGAYPYGYRTFYGKRSADAEPEAEADPALLYTTSSVAAPLTTAYTHVASPLTTAYTHVAAPLTTAYTHIAAPLTTSYTAVPAVKTVVPQVAQYTAGYPLVYGKRSADAEAEADPALLYTNTLASSVYAPLTYTHAVTAPAVKTVVPQVTYSVPVSTVHKAPAHGVAATYAGLVHSSHVGVCLNNVGAQVPC